MPRSNYTEDVSANRGYMNIQCPMYRCPHAHKFLETDVTLADVRGTDDRRKTWLRADHAAGHPERPRHGT